MRRRRRRRIILVRYRTCSAGRSVRVVNSPDPRRRRRRRRRNGYYSDVRRNWRVSVLALRHRTPARPAGPPLHSCAQLGSDDIRAWCACGPHRDHVPCPLQRDQSSLYDESFQRTAAAAAAPVGDFKSLSISLSSFLRALSSSS